jgi:prepilin-type N-terminal cleavage/methylation domain-containing protein
MRSMHRKSSSGFSLIEMMIAMALGTMVLGIATYLFAQALKASTVVGQRAEMQQNGRAAVNLLGKDISLAGAGMPTGGVQLPVTGNNPIYGCDQKTCYVPGANPTGIAYPSQHLYGVIPGYQMGLPTSAGGTNTDVVTVTYTDTTLPLNLYTVASFGPSGTSITLIPPANPPAPAPPYPQIGDPAVGIQVGDLIMITNNAGSAIGEVTGLTPSSNLINFADLDPLHINQSGAATGNISYLATNGTAASTQVNRIWVVTYYLDIPPGPDGIRYTSDDLPPRLMRQVNGQTPQPVAENIADLRFSYDIYDDTSSTETSNLYDAGMSIGKSPNQIRKVNIVSMAARGGTSGTDAFQGLDLATSISVRNMSFRDRYQ